MSTFSITSLVKTSDVISASARNRVPVRKRQFLTNIAKKNEVDNCISYTVMECSTYKFHICLAFNELELIGCFHFKAIPENIELYRVCSPMAGLAEHCPFRVSHCDCYRIYNNIII